MSFADSFHAVLCSAHFLLRDVELSNDSLSEMDSVWVLCALHTHLWRNDEERFHFMIGQVCFARCTATGLYFKFIAQIVQRSFRDVHAAVAQWVNEKLVNQWAVLSARYHIIAYVPRNATTFHVIRQRNIIAPNVELPFPYIDKILKCRIVSILDSVHWLPLDTRNADECYQLFCAIRELQSCVGLPTLSQ